MAAAQDSDEALYHRLRHEADLAAFDQLYQRYERRLFGFLLGFLRERADAEEVFHDAFLKVLASREVSFAAGSFAAWLYKIARNLALNRVRSGRRAAQATAALPRDEVVAAVDDQMDARAQRQALAQALGELPPALAEVYHLRVGGMSYEEIAFALEVPLGTVKSRMHELCERLKSGVNRWWATRSEDPDRLSLRHAVGRGCRPGRGATARRRQSPARLPPAQAPARRHQPGPALARGRGCAAAGGRRRL